jgi:hypothetical protein
MLQTRRHKLKVATSVYSVMQVPTYQMEVKFCYMFQVLMRRL